MAQVNLPSEWERLSHSARIQKAVEIGRQSRSDVKASRLLNEWRTGGFTQRLLAAFACYGSRDSDALLALSSDPSRTVSTIALSIMCHVADDASLLIALRKLPPTLTSNTLVKLRRKRTELIDRFVIERAESGDHSVWPCLPFANEVVLKKYFVFAAERGGILFWRRLASLHPEIAGNEVVSRLEATTNADGLLFLAARMVAEILSDRDPEIALNVIHALRKHVPLGSIQLQNLALRRPIAVADLVISLTETVKVNFERVAHKLDVHRILRIFRRNAGLLGDPARWLSKLAPADRELIYREIGSAWINVDGVVPTTILQRIPASTRQREARRIICLPALATRPLQRLPFVGLLTWEEARNESTPWLTHPEAENRAGALVALCEAVRYSRKNLTDLLELLQARKFEQDPVRAAFLNAMSTLPPARWQMEHLPMLAKIIRDALDASDLSANSVMSMCRLIFAMLPFHPIWVVEQLAVIVRERGYPGWFGRALTAEDVRKIAPVLTPIIASWIDREYEERVIAIATNVGRWLPDWPELVGFLKQLIQSSRNYTATTAMALIVQHVRAEREQIITAALAKDESWVTQPPVMNFLHTRRQDLMTPFLGQRTYYGRFSTGKVRHVLPLNAGFFRWTDTQQEIFAGTLSELAGPPSRQKDAQVTWDVLTAVRRLSALPAVGPERLMKFAKDLRPAVQETAVRSLGRLDARQGIPELLEAMNDSRARWAVYALRQAINDLPVSQVLDIMRNVSLAKVTVAKEAIRLAGEFGGSDAVDWFSDLHRQVLHQDVRGALLRALWDHLDHPTAWHILDESVGSPEIGVVLGLARIQVDRASDHARERVISLFKRLLHHPEPTVRLAVLNRLVSQPVPDSKRDLLSTLLEKIASPIPDELTVGLYAALVGASDADAPVFATAFSRLFPKRRELAVSVNVFVSFTRTFGNRLFEVRSAVLAALEVDPSLVSLQIRLAAVQFSPETFAHWLLKLVSTPRWNTPTLNAVVEALCESGRHPTMELEKAEEVWRHQDDPTLRWLAFKLLAKSALIDGWTDERRLRLAEYRTDPSPMVADEATLLFPPETSISENK